MGQICIPNGDTCYDCSEYAGAFACLNKIKVSGMDRISELGILTALDNKCSDILLPISKISCEGAPETLSMSLKDLIEITNSASVGERQAFPDKNFSAVGEMETYELTVSNPHPSRSMQMSYFFTWSAKIRSNLYSPTLEAISEVDDEKIYSDVMGTDVFGEAMTNWVLVDGLRGTAFYTKVVAPGETTTSKLTLRAGSFNRGDVTEEVLKAQGIQLMITGVTK